MEAVVFGGFVQTPPPPPRLLNLSTWSLYICVLGEMICLIKLVIHHHLLLLKYMAAVLSMPKDVSVNSVRDYSVS